MCLPLYALGATAIGLVNDQEGFRATAAREMHARGDWVLPTLRGQPYLAKPPMIYWIQLTIARVRGGAPDLFALRLTSVLAGWLGVVATYFLARRLARGMTRDPDRSLSAARWSAAGLAVGILFVRSARSGEIDVLLVPSVVCAIGALTAAWDSAAIRGKVHWPAIGLAMAASAAAALTKGPAPLGVIGLAIGGAILLDGARAAGTRVPAIVGTLVGAGAVGAISGARAASWADAPGVAIHACLGALAGATLGAGAAPGAVRVWGPALARCHLELVLGAGVAALWAWGEMVEARIGADAVRAAAARELEDNLRFFVAESPVNNLEFLAYGLAPVTVAALGALVWCVRERPRFSRTMLVLLAWIAGGFILFSATGKGVARYLTPLWPAIAIVGGAWIALVVRPWAERRGSWTRLRAACAATLLLCGVAQTAWYAVGRPSYYGTRSARALAESMRTHATSPPDRLGIWDLSPLTFEYHWGHVVERWNTRTFDAMVARIRSGSGEYWLLAQRETDRVARHRGSVREMLTRAGLAWSPVACDALWVQKPDSTPVEILHIRWDPR